jgi:hypothetical protein
MPGEQHGHIRLEDVPNVAGHVQLDAQDGRCSLQPLLFAARRHRQQRLEHAVAREQRMVIENDGVQLVCFDKGFTAAVVDGVPREPRIVLLAAKALLLSGRHDLAIASDGGGRVVVERRNPQDVHRHQDFPSAMQQRMHGASDSARAR